jgi:hypothetical protein
MRKATDAPSSYFFDTTILVWALQDEAGPAHKAVFSKDPLAHRFTSWTAIKELRRVFRDHPEYGVPVHDVESFVQELLLHLNVVPRAEPAALLGIKIRDKSDRPLVAEARRIGAVLVTADHHLAEDAKAYILTHLLEQ